MLSCRGYGVVWRRKSDSEWFFYRDEENGNAPLIFATKDAAEGFCLYFPETIEEKVVLVEFSTQDV